jgi:hypothetical protein
VDADALPVEVLNALKEEMEELKEAGQGRFTTEVLVKSKECMKENVKLKEENKKLKKRIEEDHKAVPSFLIKDLYLDAAEENKELKKELQEEKDGREHDVQQLQQVMDEKLQLESEVEELKDFSNWENHPALKHKVVLDEDFYNSHLNECNELISADQRDDLIEELDEAHRQYDLLKEKNNELLAKFEKFKQILTQE